MLPEQKGYIYAWVDSVNGAGFRAGVYVELVSPDAETVRRSVDEIASWSDLYEVE